MKRAFTGIALLAMACTSAVAQQTELDSLRGLLSRHPAKDAERVDLLMGLVRHSCSVDPFIADQWVDDALSTADKMMSPTHKARALIAQVRL